MESFWDFFWLMLMTFAFVAYLMVMFQIIVDLFRDHTLGGFAKAVWIVALIFVTLPAALVYLIARGRGMAERQVQQVTEMRKAQDDYIRSVAGKGAESGPSAADQIASAKALLDAGTITADEFAQLKTKALS